MNSQNGSGPALEELRRLPSHQLVSFRTPTVTGSWRAYQYEEMQSPGSIRLLKYAYMGNDREIVFNIVETPLDEAAGNFVAVSYYWGTADNDRKLSLGNGTYIAITETIELLLEHITLFTDTDSIWIDAICINQENNAEKSNQVSMMGEIYSNAKSVRVWLGKADGDVESNLWDYLQSLIQNSVQGIVLNKFDDRDQYLWPVFDAKWFSRIWVIQEACLARQVLVHYGRISISLGYLRMVATLRSEQPLSIGIRRCE
ncbi:heterokaryon incompatibility protein-domain-containing protein [Leptodontidium sp. MPI-SDFR-AT-0119]|nr:heterokaryon incompatibility protein-domain-containing protein [Leptodontidium sp. MPI-SDFR-AT-0119]